MVRRNPDSHLPSPALFIGGSHPNFIVARVKEQAAKTKRAGSQLLLFSTKSGMILFFASVESLGKMA